MVAAAAAAAAATGRRRTCGGGRRESVREGGKRFRRCGRGRESESKESKELFQASLPRPARLNFFSAQEFSYYSKFSSRAARQPRPRSWLRPRDGLHAHNVRPTAFYMRIRARTYVCTIRSLASESRSLGARLAPTTLINIMPTCMCALMRAYGKFSGRGAFFSIGGNALKCVVFLSNYPFFSVLMNKLMSRC